MRFFSDNAAPVCQPVIDAMLAANTLDTAYDGDRWSQALDARFADLFETQVRVLWVPTGTAANCLALTALCPPHGPAGSGIQSRACRGYRGRRDRGAGRSGGGI